MNGATRPLALIGMCAVLVGIAAVAGAAGLKGPNDYTVNNLVSDIAGRAPVHDPNLRNPWGLAFTAAGSPFWVADNSAGVATLYDGDGAILPIVIRIPAPAGAASGFISGPTGLVWNPTTNPATAFLVPGTNIPATFIFDTQEGTISAWGQGLKPANRAVLAVDNSAAGAVYKGLAFGMNVNGAFLFATNFRAGTVDVFDHTFAPATTEGGFIDSNLPAGYAPFGIQNLDGDIFVTYAKQGPSGLQDIAGIGHGFVDVFDTNGRLLRRFANRGTLNSPWGVARASFAFGRFSGEILIGNLRDGKINAFDSAGNFLGQLNKSDGTPISISGLWTLTLGGAANSSSDTLYFTAGIGDYTHGAFGTITPVAMPQLGPADAGANR